MAENSATIRSIKSIMKGWFFCFACWSAIHYIFGMAATVGAIVVSAKIYPDYQTEISAGVAICTAILTFLNAQAKANAYITAWRTMNKAMQHLFAINPEEKKLADAYAECEDIIGKSD
ncbi:hypothetical protein [Pseudomonas sp. 5P_5.1_Bac1]|uniref:hypothetical protein n=1 Tax=Pseudomonas sp. 5P_5.1_Bac1 TaxID=2971616 RepID=UPI0021C919C4|nr:hypothetical protein [Pseudomonas sp. 5P_5.1_Bac1]MCU1724234.1 hypothetical protein [Pseudomonas sp. 5P_5.1_Bac1]